MAQDIFYTATNVINGRAAVAGQGVPAQTAVTWSHSQAIPSGDAYARQGQKLETLYIYHGGVGGSGNWEH